MAAPTSYTWTGAASAGVPPGAWSGSNWQSGAPAQGASVGTLTFPALTTPCGAGNSDCYLSYDDVAGLIANDLSLDDTGGYAFYGDAAHVLTLGSGGLQATPQGVATGTPNVDIPIALGADQTWSITGAAPTPAGVTFDSGAPISPTTHTLGVQLSSDGALYLYGDEELGAFTATGANSSDMGARASLNGSLSVASLNATNGSSVTLRDINLVDDPNENTNLPHSGVSLGSLVTNGANLQIGDGNSPDGILSVHGSVTLDAATNTVMFIDQGGTTVGADFSQMTATGPVTLNGTLSVNGACGLGTGDAATLVTTAGVLTGTFTNAPNQNETIPLTQYCPGAPTVYAEITYSAHTVTATVVSSQSTGTPAPTPTPISTAPTGGVSVGAVKVSGSTASVPMTCDGTVSCSVELTLSETETVQDGKVIAVSAGRHKKRKKVVIIGRARATLSAGQKKIVRITLSPTGKRLLAKEHKLKVLLAVMQSKTGKSTTVKKTTLTFKASKH